MLSSIGSALKHTLGMVDDGNAWSALRKGFTAVRGHNRMNRAITASLLRNSGVKGKSRILNNLTDAQRQFVTGATGKLREHMEAVTIGNRRGMRLSEEGQRILREKILPQAPGAMAPEEYGSVLTDFFSGRLGGEGNAFLARAPRWGRAAFRGGAFAAGGLGGLWVARGPFNMLRPGNQPGLF